MKKQLSGAELIAAERQRHVTEEGRSAEHDDAEHWNGDLARAAACYCLNSLTDRCRTRVPTEWPWAMFWWKPKNPIRDLVRAGALIAGEIDRLQRKEKQ